MAISIPADNAAPYTYTQPIRDSITRVNALTDDVTGRVPVVRLGSNSGGSTKYLNGDGDFTVPATGGGGTTGLPPAARTVYLTDPPSGSGLSAVLANGTDERAKVQAALDYVDTTWGSGYVIGPIGSTVKINTGITIPTKVQLRDMSDLDCTSMTGTGFAITVNDSDFAPIYNVTMRGPSKSSTVRGLLVQGTGLLFDRIAIRYFGTDVDLSTNNTYINTFSNFAIGESNRCINQDFSTSGANNSGEKTVFNNGAFFNSNDIFYVTNNQGGVFVNNCSLDYSSRMGYFTTAHIFFKSCHIESNFVTTSSGYFFEPAFECRLQFTACNFMMGSTGGEGLRFIIRPNTGPSTNGRGRVIFDPTCTAYFVDTTHTGQQRWAEELVWIDPTTTAKTFETPFVSNWNVITARPGRYQGDVQGQATVTVTTGFSSGAQNGSVTVTAPTTVPAGTWLPVRIDF